MPNITLDAIVLDGDLIWTDEFQWTPVERSSDYSLTGVPIIQESVKQAGRPITLDSKPESQSELAGSNSLIWMDRATVKALHTKASIPELTMTLTLGDGRTFTVAFREDGFNARPVRHITPHQDTDPYYLSIKLMTV